MILQVTCRAAPTRRVCIVPRWRRPHEFVFSATLVLLGLVQPAAAQVRALNPAGDTVRVSLNDVRALAHRQNPGLIASRLDTAVARGELRQAGLLLAFNPAIDLLGAGAGQGTEVGVTQEVEIFGQRAARRAAARAGYAGARAGVADAVRLVTGELDRSFFRLVSATRRAGLAQEVLALNQRLADVTGRQLQAGEISRLDFNLAVIELGRSRSRTLVTQRERKQSEIELVRLAGLPPGTVVIPLTDSLVLAPRDSAGMVSLSTVDGHSTRARRLRPDSLVELALRRRPDLAAREAAAQQASAQASVARREALPNLVLRGSSERETGSPRRFRPGVGLTVPLFNRNQGEVEARRAAASQAELQRSALGAQVRSEVASAVAAYEAAAMEVEVLESAVLVPARQNRELLETAYREGKIGLPELLLIRNQAIDAELDYWTAWLTEHEALADLAAATGETAVMPSATR